MIRNMLREEIHQIWTIDRREVIHNTYQLKEGALVLNPDYFDMQGWPTGEAEIYTPLLLDCFAHGGTFYGAYDGEILAGVVVLENHFIGAKWDTLQLKFLHISAAYRKQGLGRRLFEMAAIRARELGAKKMYVSATPSENTIHFYQRMGCILANQVDPLLLQLEPEDIHLEYDLLDR
jgi:predicted N-acetyltransferase YhbS